MGNSHKLIALTVCLGLLASCSSSDSPAGPGNKTTAADVTTSSVSTVTQTTAQCGGSVISDGGATVTVRGVCWSTNATPTITDSKTTDGSGTGTFTSSITSLVSNTTYYVRAYATNTAGTGYGAARTFTTASANTVTDYDGNVYSTVTIGTQVWMAENLRVTHYRNGNAIPNLTDSSVWATLTTGAYCSYNNDVNNVATNGRLYNWYAVTDSRMLAPLGWHVPTDAEWQTLVNFLGGLGVAGGKMKEVGTTHWQSPNTGATNESNFSALPSGSRFPYAHLGGVGFIGLGQSAHFWSTTATVSGYALSFALNFDNALGIYGDEYTDVIGMSIRCVKD